MSNEIALQRQCVLTIQCCTWHQVYGQKKGGREEVEGGGMAHEWANGKSNGDRISPVYAKHSKYRVHNKLYWIELNCQCIAAVCPIRICAWHWKSNEGKSQIVWCARLLYSAAIISHTRQYLWVDEKFIRPAYDMRYYLYLYTGTPCPDAGHQICMHECSGDCIQISNRRNDKMGIRTFLIGKRNFFVFNSSSSLFTKRFSTRLCPNQTQSHYASNRKFIRTLHVRAQVANRARELS